jgi:hypothetical protein
MRTQGVAPSQAGPLAWERRRRRIAILIILQDARGTGAACLNACREDEQRGCLGEWGSLGGRMDSGERREPESLRTWCTTGSTTPSSGKRRSGMAREGGTWQSKHRSDAQRAEPGRRAVSADQLRLGGCMGDSVDDLMSPCHFSEILSLPPLPPGHPSDCF